MADLLIAHFADEVDGGFFDTSDDHEALLQRPKEIQDNAVPSGNAMAALVLARLALFTGEGAYWDRAAAAAAAVVPAMTRYPTGFAHWLTAALQLTAAPREIAVIGDPAAADTRALLDIVYEAYRPHQVVAAGLAADGIPLLLDRPQREGAATAFVCSRFACRQPVTSPDELAAQLTAD